MHVNIAGPMLVNSACGKDYLYVIVDDFTRAVHVRPLRLKSDAVEAFKSFKAVDENESGKEIQEVLMDNACELCLGKMGDLCKQEGIKLHTMVPYRPASNGVAERTIRVLTSVVRVTLRDPDYLWAEAFSVATYVHNRTSTRVLEGLTPFHCAMGSQVRKEPQAAC